MESKAMQLKLTTLVAAAAKKGTGMVLNIKKNQLSRIRVFFIMFLFAVCITVNALFCSAYNLYELLDKTTVSETWKISESIVTNEDGNNTACFRTLFLNKNNSSNETITKNRCSILMITAIPKAMGLLLFLIIVFLFFFLTLFILLPDKWTLINHKVRLDN
ncbi:hypothetical protein MCI89_02255 [Muricomes sp. OA1]|nr:MULTISPECIES: hypothetical protein [Clostridia]MCH1971168.1 hypothetical protein [Muricomes sp. OA1]GKH34465.1 hypothetical protein CE91St64_38720 [Faecalicatena contorta]